MQKPANITMVTYNRLELTKRSLESLLNLTRGDFCVNIVDNASSDETWSYLEETRLNDNRVRIFRLSRNMGVQVAANYGWALDVDVDYIKFDNDIEVLDGDWLEIMLDYGRGDSRLGFIAYQFMEALTPAMITLQGGQQFLRNEMCGGACVLIGPATHRRLGFWNEDYGKYGYEDVDYCMRCSLNDLLCGYIPVQGKVRHLGSLNTNHDYEQNKCDMLKSDNYGSNIFIYNQMMFHKGIRNTRVERKMLPMEGTDPLRFKFNPEYTSILRILRKMQTTIPLKVESNRITMNFANWKKEV